MELVLDLHLEHSSDYLTESPDRSIDSGFHFVEPSRSRADSHPPIFPGVLYRTCFSLPPLRRRRRWILPYSLLLFETSRIHVCITWPSSQESSSRGVGLFFFYGGGGKEEIRQGRKGLMLMDI